MIHTSNRMNEREKMMIIENRVRIEAQIMKLLLVCIVRILPSFFDMGDSKNGRSSCCFLTRIASMLRKFH